jgi:hypothetical protein
MGSRDLSALPTDVRESAHVLDNGEVEWRPADARAAINALAATGHVVLGLDLRSYPDGPTFEVPWSIFKPVQTMDMDANIEAGRQVALNALARDNFTEFADYAEWIRITWQHRAVPFHGSRRLRL